MPRKVFVAGEILTAADVNTNLMDQAVMVFDDATARGSAIPTPSEGMVTYLKDTDSVEVYDGAAFVAAAPAQTGVLQVVSVSKTDPFSASLALQASANVTDLSITHTVSNASNKVLLLAQIGHATSNIASGAASFAFAQDDVLLNIGDTNGSRTRVSVGKTAQMANTGAVGGAYHLSLLVSPGAGSKTYTVRVINADDDTRTMFVNRSQSTENANYILTASSTFTLMEVAG